MDFLGRYWNSEPRFERYKEHICFNFKKIDRRSGKVIVIRVWKSNYIMATFGIGLEGYFKNLVLELR